MNSNFKYQNITHRPNPMKTLNPLARSSGKRVTLDDRVNQLESSNSWQRAIKAHKKNGVTFQSSMIPKICYIKLGKSVIDHDIQRSLDEKHCANKIGGELFDPRYLQPIFAILNSKGEYVSIDGQHSTSTVAGLISAGLFAGVEDWRDLEYPCIYIETDDLSFARKAFGIVNGKGKKKISPYTELRNAVFCVRIDKNTSDPNDVLIERKVSIAEKYNCYPVEQNSELSQYPGTFTHISLFELQNETILEEAFKWHNKYFHMDSVHASLFPIFRDIVNDFESAKIKFTAKLAEEIAGIIQNLFGDLEQFGQAAMQARTEWHTRRYGYEGHWHDDQYAVVLFQLYVMLGGKENVPLALLDTYYDPKSNTGIADFLSTEILDLAA